MKKNSLKKLVTATALIVTSLYLTTGIAQSSQTAKSKKVASKKEVKPSNAAREMKLLGKTSAYPTSYSVNDPDFFVRGTVLDFKQLANSKKWEIQILPLEVLNNPNHYVSMDHYRNGLTVALELNPQELKNLKKGGIVEYNRYSKDAPTQSSGHAKLVSTTIYTDFKPYNVAPISYLTQPGFEPEQMINAIKGTLLYNGPIEKSDALKATLENLSKGKNGELSNEAKKLFDKFFS